MHINHDPKILFLMSVLEENSHITCAKNVVGGVLRFLFFVFEKQTNKQTS